MFSFLSSNQRTKHGKSSARAPVYIARDDLDVKHKKGAIEGETKPSFHEMKYEEIRKEGDEKEVRMRVKVLMTKEQAARLLSKCNNGGTIDFKDVTRELVQIPMNHVSAVSLKIPNNDYKLESIPEEV